MYELYDLSTIKYRYMTIEYRYVMKYIDLWLGHNPIEYR